MVRTESETRAGATVTYRKKKKDTFGSIVLTTEVFDAMIRVRDRVRNNPAKTYACEIISE